MNDDDDVDVTTIFFLGMQVEKLLVSIQVNANIEHTFLSLSRLCQRKVIEKRYKNRFFKKKANIDEAHSKYCLMSCAD